MIESMVMPSPPAAAMFQEEGWCNGGPSDGSLLPQNGGGDQTRHRTESVRNVSHQNIVTCAPPRDIRAHEQSHSPPPGATGTITPCIRTEIAHTKKRAPLPQGLPFRPLSLVIAQPLLQQTACMFPANAFCPWCWKLRPKRGQRQPGSVSASTAPVECSRGNQQYHESARGAQHGFRPCHHFHSTLHEHCLRS